MLVRLAEKVEGEGGCSGDAVAGEGPVDFVAVVDAVFSVKGIVSMEKTLVGTTFLPVVPN